MHPVSIVLVLYTSDRKNNDLVRQLLSFVFIAIAKMGIINRNIAPYKLPSYDAVTSLAHMPSADLHRQKCVVDSILLLLLRRFMYSQDLR